MEDRVVELVNRQRAAAGLGPLAESERLATAARAWSAEMAAQGELAHDPELAVPQGATQAAENVAYREPVAEGTADRLHAQLTDSPAHNANMMDPQASATGVGIVIRAGRAWLTQRFSG
jgi:uncharacterized protein YkwD